MSNSDAESRRGRAGTAGRPSPGYSPSVMWATFKSHLTPMSSGNCSRYSVKYPIAAREPSGLVCTAAGIDRNDARAFAAAEDAVFVLTQPHRRNALKIDHAVEPLLRDGVAAREPRSRSPRAPAEHRFGFAVVLVDRRLDQSQDDLCCRRPTASAERLRRSARCLRGPASRNASRISSSDARFRPSRQRGQDRREAAGIDRLPLAVGQVRPPCSRPGFACPRDIPQPAALPPRQPESARRASDLAIATADRRPRSRGSDFMRIPSSQEMTIP